MGSDVLGTKNMDGLMEMVANNAYTPTFITSLAIYIAGCMASIYSVSKMRAVQEELESKLLLRELKRQEN